MVDQDINDSWWTFNYFPWGFKGGWYIAFHDVQPLIIAAFWWWVRLMHHRDILKGGAICFRAVYTGTFIHIGVVVT